MSPTPESAGSAGSAQSAESSTVSGRLRRRISDPSGLRDRVEQLEAEVAEMRGLSLRIAELTDLVTELVVPLAQVDPERARVLTEKYQGELGQ